MGDRQKIREAMARLEAAEKEIAAIKAEMEKPPCPFKVGDRVVYIGDESPEYKGRVGNITEHDHSSIPYGVNFSGDHNWARTAHLRHATPAEIAREDFGLEVGDEVNRDEWRSPAIIESFYLREVGKPDDGVWAKGTDHLNWPCSELKKVQPPEAPKPKIKPGDWVTVTDEHIAYPWSSEEIRRLAGRVYRVKRVKMTTFLIGLDGKNAATHESWLRPATEAEILADLARCFPVGRRVKIVGRDGALEWSDPKYIGREGVVDSRTTRCGRDPGVEIEKIYIDGKLYGQTLHPFDLTLLPEESPKPRFAVGDVVWVRCKVAASGLSKTGNVHVIDRQAGMDEYNLFFSPKDIYTIPDLEAK